MRKFNKILALSGLIGILGCNPEPTIEMKVAPQKVEAQEHSDYSISRVGVFKDDLAYNQLRGIYEIIDNKTGKKYIGVSGIGICELGSHRVNKADVPDER